MTDVYVPPFISFLMIASVLAVAIAVIVAVVFEPQQRKEDGHSKRDDVNAHPSGARRSEESTMEFCIGRSCAECDADFWWTPDEQRAWAEPPQKCPSCRAGKRSSNQTSDRRSEGSVASVEPNSMITRKSFFADINALLDKGIKPVDAEPIGFWERFGAGGDEQVWARRRAHNMKVIAEADALVVQRKEAFEHIQQMLIAAASVQRVELDIQADALASRLRLVKLQGELEDYAHGRRSPTSAPDPSTAAREQAVNDHRSDLKAKANAKRGALADLLAAVRDVFESGASDEQRATEIRELLRVYRQSEAVLSPKIRRFLEFAEMEDVER